MAVHSPTDVWAVGEHTPDCCGRAECLIIHWDGTVWSIVATPANDPYHGTLYSVAALSATDVWAVGKTLLHGDGTTWRVVPSPATGSLLSISARAFNDIWAVGRGGGATTIHWDGTTWMVSPNPTVPYPYAVAARTANDVWVVGTNDGGTYGQPVVGHWDGTTWRTVPAEAAGNREQKLRAVVALEATNVWAVGEALEDTLVEHYSGPCGPPTVTPTPAGSATSTRTPSPPSPTAILSPSPTATLPPLCPAWAIVSSPNPPGAGAGAVLYDVGAITATDLWAVGAATRSDGVAQTLVEHWDGMVWSVVPSPNVGSGPNDLRGVTAVAANDVWAVGATTDSAQVSRTLILHWDGWAWTVVPSPSPGAGHSRLNRIAGVGATDLWAVGYYQEHLGDDVRSLTMHWTGSGWTLVASPNRSGDQPLNGVTALAANEVWAVGGRNTEDLIIHWDGSSWTVALSPNRGALQAITALAPDQIWVVGMKNVNGVMNPLLERWNGQVWQEIPLTWSAGTGVLNGIVALPGGQVWVVGAYENGAALRTLTMEWDGTWHLIPSANNGADDNVLLNIAAVSATDLWAVGFQHLSPLQTLVEHYPNSCLIATPTPEPTTSPVPTATPPRTSIPSTTVSPAAPGTPSRTASPTPTHPPHTATPTICTLAFVDVPAGSTFYDFVRCLACRSIVNGYACGGPGEPCPGAYYRPGNNVTRGQVSKIVSSAAGFNNAIPSTQQRFQDVPPSGTFWLWVERLSGRSIVGGYACGSNAFEPCVAPDNRPYFRPNNDVTRGQLSKIVSGAAGYSETPTGQIFEDTAPTSTFYLWVERLSSRGIIGGYPCGGAGEPCVAPGNRPYFRAFNNATRGQMSKIAASTFLPGCQTPTPVPTATGTATPTP